MSSSPLFPCRSLVALVALVALVGLVALSGCSAGSTCLGSGRSLTIVSPEDGASAAGSEVEIVVEACGFERDDVIALILEQPVATDYGFVTFLEDPELRLTVPTLPGEMRFYATDDASRTLRSETVTVSTSP